MKSYKQIQEEIKPNERLKQRTKEAMMNKKKYFPVKGLALVVICIVLFAFTIHMTMEQDSPSKAPFDFHKYIIEEKQEISKVAMDVAGVEEVMNKELITAFKAKVPLMESLWIPSGLENQHMELLQYRYEDIGPYGIVQYLLKDKEDENHFVSIRIEDRRTPRCLPLQLKGKRYKEYQLEIIKNSSEGYSVYAEKENLRYEMQLHFVSEVEIFAFLDSFFV